MSRGGRTRFRMLICRRMRRRMRLGGRGRACSGALRRSLRMGLRARRRGVRRLGIRRLGIRAVRRLRAGSRGGLCKHCARRSAGTHQDQGATAAQPSSYFRAMLPLRFQKATLRPDPPRVETLGFLTRALPDFEGESRPSTKTENCRRAPVPYRSRDYATPS